jgi:hypothetical protein
LNPRRTQSSGHCPQHFVAVVGLPATATGGAVPAALAATVLHDNTDNPANTFYAAQGGAEALDDLHLISAGRVDSLVFEHDDPAIGETFSATALPRGRRSGAIALPDGLNAGTDLWVGVRFSSATAGLILQDVPSVGSSHDVYLENGAFYWFGGGAEGQLQAAPDGHVRSRRGR